MAIVGIRDLNKNTKAVIERLEQTREPVILTRQGQPIATILPLDQRRLNDLVVSMAPEFADGMRRAEQQLDAGETRSLSDAMAEIRAKRGSEQEAEEPAQAAVMARVRHLSEAIVDDAIAHGVLSRESSERGEPEPLDTIAEVNARLYDIALAAERFRAIEGAMQEMAEPLKTVTDPNAVIAAESIDLEDLASAHVRNINRWLLSYGERQGGMSLAEYARSLRQTSNEAFQATGDPIAAGAAPLAEA